MAKETSHVRRFDEKRCYTDENLRAALGLKRATLEEFQTARLRGLLNELLESNRFYQRKLAGVDLSAADELLARLPFTTRAELHEDQIAFPPYGSNLTRPLGEFTRLHQTSGTFGRPLYWLDTRESWAWFKNCWQAVFAAAGVRGRNTARDAADVPGTEADTVGLTFSFGPFIGFWAAFEAAADLGCRVLPAGGMSSVARIQQLLTHRATVLCCTPTYALHLAEVALKESIDLRSGAVRVIVVAGEPGGSVPATRRLIEEAWGARVHDHAGMTEVGAWGFELRDCPGGLHVLETEFIPEVIDPATLRAVPDGSAGELVLTNLGRAACPLIRYRTGDVVTLERSPAAGVPTGVNMRWARGGVQGRVDDMLVIRGNNVFPSAVENILREIPEVAEFRLRPVQRGALVDLVVEVEPREESPGPRLREQVEEAIRDRLHFRAEVQVAPVGSLPRFEFKARRVERTAS